MHRRPASRVARSTRQSLLASTPACARGVSAPRFCEPLEDRLLFYHTYYPTFPDARWTTTQLSYSYSNLLDGWASGVGQVDMLNAVKEGMGIWAAHTPLAFFQKVDSGPAASDDLYPASTHPLIRWGHHYIDGPTPIGGSSAAAHGQGPGLDGHSGDIHFDDSDSFTLGDFLQAAAHELGHAIGMAHANGNVVGGVEPTPVGALMDAVLVNGRYPELGTAFLYDDDIAGIQSLYGAGLGYVIDLTGQLNVYGTGVSDVITADVSNGFLTVSSIPRAGGAMRSFTRALYDGNTNVTSIYLHGMNGDDILRIEKSGGLPVTMDGGTGDDIFDLSFANRNLDLISGQENLIFAGSGNDALYAYDNNNSNAGNNTYSAANVSFTRSGWAGVRFFSDLENRTLFTGDAVSTVNVLETLVGTTTTINNGGSIDTVNVGAFNNLAYVRGILNIEADAGLSNIVMDDSGSAVAKAIDIHIINASQCNIHGLAGTTVYFDPNDTNNINLTTGVESDTVRVYELRNKLFLKSAGGTDDIQVGTPNSSAGWITGPIEIGPNPGFVRSDVTIDRSNTSIPGVISFLPSGAGTIVTGLSGYLYYTSVASVTLRAGAGSDNITIGPILDIDLTIDGGTGTNSLTVDDRANPRIFTSATISDQSIARSTAGFLGTTATVSYANFNNITYYARFSCTVTNVTGTQPASGIGSQFTVILDTGNDTIHIGPTPAPAAAAAAATSGTPASAGPLSLSSSLIILDSGGTDTLVVDDSASNLARTLNFFNGFAPGLQDFTGLGPAIVRTGGIDDYVINTGAADDTFTVEQFLAGVHLFLNAGAGADALNLAPVSQNLYTNFAPSSYISFDGQADYDNIHLYNGSAQPLSPFTYSHSDTKFLVTADFAGFALQLFDSNVEGSSVSGGPSAETFAAASSQPGSIVYFYGNGGADNFQIGQVGELKYLNGYTVFYGDGNDTATVNNFLDNLPRSFHIQDDNIGYFPGDSLFAPGGGLSFFGIAALTVNLGTGADTVYARPNAFCSVTLNANNPPGGASDVLVLALADAIGPVITPGAPGAGGLTADNRLPISWTGFETVPAPDATTPYVTSIAFNDTANPQSLVFTFSEALAYTPNYALTLVETSTGVPLPISYANLAEAYDANAHTMTYTFPGFPGGILPAGVYHASINHAYLSDLAGNVMPADPTFSFLWVPAGATLAPGDTATTLVQAVAVAPGGVLDLGHGALVLDYDTDGAAALAQLAALISSGRNGYDANIVTNWDGHGITSSSARDQSVAAGFDLYTLGIIDNANFADPNIGRDTYTAFRGLTVDASSILIRFTYAGDADLNGFVDGDDYALIDNAYNLLIPNFGWMSGDFNFDINIDGDDYALIDSGFLFQAAPIL